MFHGCCFLNDGTYTNTILLSNIEDTLTYVKLQVLVNKEARIVDEDDHVVMRVIDGKIIL